jgi:hypothetical protein
VNKRSPILGYNHNFSHRGLVFHVQTEDSGVSNPHIFTHLFHGGVIVSSRKLEYDSEASEEAVKSLMQAQHKAVLKDLRHGKFDEKIELYLGDNPELKPRRGAKERLAPDTLVEVVMDDDAAIGSSPGMPAAPPAAGASAQAEFSAESDVSKVFRTIRREDTPEPELSSAIPELLEEHDTTRTPMEIEVKEALRVPTLQNLTPPAIQPPAVSGSSSAAKGKRPSGEYQVLRDRASTRPPPVPADARSTGKRHTGPQGPPRPVSPGAADSEPVPATLAARRPSGKHRSLDDRGVGGKSGGVVVSRPSVIVGAPPKPVGSPRREGARAPRRAREEPRLFGKDLISEKSLDEVILAYLSEDASEE